MHHLGLGAEGLGVKSLTTALTVFFFSFRFIQYARVVKAAVNVAPH